MTRKQLDREIELVRAENQAAIERADASIREFNRLAPIYAVKTERAFRQLREAARRR
jgi:hypothetical protein